MKPGDTLQTLLAACLKHKEAEEEYQKARQRITKEAMALDSGRDRFNKEFTDVVDRMLKTGVIKRSFSYRVGEWTLCVWPDPQFGGAVSVMMFYTSDRTE